MGNPPLFSRESPSRCSLRDGDDLRLLRGFSTGPLKVNSDKTDILTASILARSPAVRAGAAAQRYAHHKSPAEIAGEGNRNF